MKLKSVVVSAVAVGFFLALVILVYSLVSEDPPYTAIIVKAIELRNVKNDSVARARMVSSLDNLVATTKGDEAKVQWSKIIDCLSSQCADDQYFDLIVASALEGQKSVHRARLIVDLIATARFWGTQEVIEFSKALASSDEQVAAMRSKLLGRQWDVIVACDGKCAEKNDLFFDLVRVVVLQKEG